MNRRKCVLLTAADTWPAPWDRWLQLSIVCYSDGVGAWLLSGAAHGLTAAEKIRRFGARAIDFDGELRRVIDREVQDTAGVVAAPGAHEVRTLGSPFGVVTSGTDRLARTRLTVIGLPVPTVMVTADPVPESKPHPRPYLAADLLGVTPARCVVVECAPAGVAAGNATGMTVVALTTTAERHALAGADLVFDSLAEFLAWWRASVRPSIESH